MFRLDVPVFPKADPIADYVIADGTKLPVWQRAVQRSESVLGVGNGDGKAQPGEMIVIAARDGNAVRPVEVFTSDPCLDTSKRVSDPWAAYDNVGATAKYTILLIASSCKGPRDIPLFVRYQLPNKPEHVLEEHVLTLSISGRDTTPPHAESAAVRHWNRLEARITDGARVAAAVATLTAAATVLHLSLNDDGRGGDLVAGDGIFTGLAPNPPVGRYTVRIEAKDEFGNSTDRLMEEELEFTLPSPSALRWISDEVTSRAPAAARSGRAGTRPPAPSACSEICPFARRSTASPWLTSAPFTHTLTWSFRALDGHGVPLVRRLFGIVRQIENPPPFACGGSPVLLGPVPLDHVGHRDVLEDAPEVAGVAVVHLHLDRLGKHLRKGPRRRGVHQDAAVARLARKAIFDFEAIVAVRPTR